MAVISLPLWVLLLDPMENRQISSGEVKVEIERKQQIDAITLAVVIFEYLSKFIRTTHLQLCCVCLLHEIQHRSW